MVVLSAKMRSCVIVRLQKVACGAFCPRPKSAVFGRSYLRRQLVDEIGVRTRIDLTLKKLRGRLHRDLRHFAAQALASMGRVQLDLLMRGSHESLTFGRRSALGLLDEVVGAVLCLVDDLRGALAGFTNDRLRLLARLGKRLLAFLAGSETLRDLARTLFHGAENHRPHVFHREPDEGREDQHLNDERQIDVHSRLLTWGSDTGPAAWLRARFSAPPPATRQRTDS